MRIIKARACGGTASARKLNRHLELFRRKTTVDDIVTVNALLTRCHIKGRAVLIKQQ